jgi:hypothetical protein
VVIVTERTIRRVPPLGITKLSELEIDVDRDWGKKNIVNFGPGGIDLHSTVTSHASRHTATGPDPIRGWIFPDLIGPASNENYWIRWRTRNVAGTEVLDHFFEPLDDTFGFLGFANKRWDGVYAYFHYMWHVRVRGGGTSYFPMDANVHHTLIPLSDGFSYIGTATRRFHYIRGVTVVSGDLGVEDRRCLVCGREFKEGDAVVFKVRRVDGENMQVLLVPVHAECNPHPLNPELLREHEKMLLPNRGEGEQFELNPPGPEEFEVVSVTVEDDKIMTVNALCGDGTFLSFPAPVDADEETIAKLAREYYDLFKKKEARMQVKIAEGTRKLKRNWRGFKAKLK